MDEQHTAPSAGLRLRLARVAERLTQEQAAAALSTQGSMISRLETDQITPSLPLAVAIERRFGVAATSWVAATNKESAERDQASLQEALEAMVVCAGPRAGLCVDCPWAEWREAHAGEDDDGAACLARARDAIAGQLA